MEENKEETPVENLEEKQEKIQPEETPKEEQPVETLTEENKQPEQKKKKSKTAVIIGVVCIVIALLGIAAVVAFVTLRGNTNKEKAKVDKPVTASPYQLSGNGLENFDLYFMQLENNKKNMVYSPLSIKYALAMLNAGTDGTTHEQIESVIGDYKAKKYPNNEHMSFANALYIRDSFKKQVKEDYVKTLKDSYGAEVMIDPFTSPDSMNTWISNKTFHLIENMLDDSVSEYDFFIINALAIDMNWNFQLQCETTEARRDGKLQCKYYSVDYKHEKYSDYVKDLDDNPGRYDSIDFNGKKVKATEIGASINNYDIIKDLGEDTIRKTVGDKLKEYMDNGGEMCDYSYDEFMDKYMKEIGENYKQVDSSTDFYLYDSSELKAFAKDLQTYDNMTLQYVAVMPKEASLDAYIKDLDAKSLNNIINNLKDIKLENFKEGTITKIRGHIPLFKYEYDLKLMEDLQKLGIEDVFDINKADLSKLIEQTNAKEREYIAKADHKANIEFSNDGIKASAVTVFGGRGSSSCPMFDYEFDVPVETIDITFNKPYMYIIRDKDSGEVWFAGTVYEPTES